MKKILCACFTIAFAITIMNCKPRTEIVLLESLIPIIDTVLLGITTEGVRLELYQIPQTKDSVLKVAFYRETGRTIYLFKFNKKLLSAEEITHKYSLPIMADFGPDVNVTPGKEEITKETLETSEEARKRLTNTFFEFKRVILNE